MPVFDENVFDPAVFDVPSYVEASAAWVAVAAGTMAGNVVRSASQAMVAVAAVQATPNARVAASSALVGVGTMTPSGGRRIGGGASLVGVASLTAAGAIWKAASAALIGVGAMTASGTPRRGGSAALIGAALLTPVPNARVAAAWSKAGVAVMTPAGGARVAGQSSMVGVALLVPSPTRRIGGAVSMVGVAVPKHGIAPDWEASIWKAAEAHLIGVGRMDAAGVVRAAASVSMIGVAVAVMIPTARKSGTVNMVGVAVLTPNGDVQVFAPSMLTAAELASVRLEAETLDIPPAELVRIREEAEAIIADLPSGIVEAEMTLPDRALHERPTPVRQPGGGWVDTWAVINALLPCAVDGPSPVEVTHDGRTENVLRATIRMSVTVDVRDKDRLTISGRKYKVVGIREHQWAILQEVISEAVE